MLKRTLPVGVSRDYQELQAFHGERLAGAASTLNLSAADLVSRLQELKVVEGFDLEEHFPQTLDWKACVHFLGLTDEGWHRLLVRTRGELSHLRPNTVGAEADSADPYDTFAIYWGLDILRIADYLDQQGIQRDAIQCEPLVTAFVSHLETQMGGLKPESSWPKELPKTNEELAKMYGAYVFDQVRRISTIKTEAELEEVTQQLWLNLVNSRVLEKFIEAARTKLPRTLTVNEAIGYLGITFEQWTSAMAYRKRNPATWMPLPLKGTEFSRLALYSTDDILTLDSSDFLKGRRNAPRQHPELTGRGFKSYLAQAIRNHFYNLIRTRSRRHKERCQDDKVVLTSDSSGTFHKAYTSDESISWEDNLSDGTGPDMEDLIDLASQLRRHGVNPNTENGREVLDLMTKGMTIKEALRSQQRQKTRMVATG